MSTPSKREVYQQKDGSETQAAVLPRAKGLSISTFVALRNSNFRLLWATSFFASGGQWIQQITMGWLVWTLSNSPVMVGVVSGARAIPFLFIGPIAGVAIDRIDRRKMLTGVSIVMAVSATVFAVLVITRVVQVWHAAVYMFFYGSCWAVLAPLRQSLVANTVPRGDLMNAIALQSMAFNFTRTVAPVVGGFLIVLVDMGGNFLIQAAAMLTIAFLAIPLKTPYRRIAPISHSATSNLKEGFKYVWKEPVMMALMAMAFIPSFFIMPMIQQLPVITSQVFKAGPEVLGFLMSSFGIGALVGTVVLASVRTVNKRGAMGLGLLAASAVALVLFAQSHWLALSVLLLALMGLFEMGFRLTNNTMVQTLVPDFIRGRVSSIYMAEHGLMPAGALIMGTLLEVLGTQIALSIMGALGLAFTLLIATFYGKRLRKV